MTLFCGWGELKELGTCEPWGEKSNPEWRKADEVDFLNIIDLLRALELDTVKNDKKKELYVRHSIWWAFNDRVRANKPLYKDNEEVLWKQNCLRLIELYDDTTDINQKITVAELYRNLGEFEICMELINSLDNEFDWLIETFKVECENKNKLLKKIR